MSRLRAQVFLVTLNRLVLNTMHRMVYPFLAVFGRGLGVDIATLSRLVSIRALFGVFAPLLASRADNQGRKTGMLLGFVLFTAGTATVVVWPTFTSFILVMILTLVGKYVYDPAMQAYLGDRVLYKHRGKVLAITELSWSLSFILGIPMIGLMIARGSWLSPFPAFTILGLLGILALAILLPNDVNVTQGRTTVWGNIQQVITYRPALAGLSVSLLISAANEVINLVFGVWMEDAFQLKIAGLGAAAAVIGVSELGGEAISSLFTDRLGKPAAVRIGILANCLAAIALPFAGNNWIGAISSLFFFYITFEFTIVSSIPLMTEIQPKARATLMALNVAGHSLGRAIGASLAGGLYDGSILGSSLATIALNLLALFALRILHKTIPN